MQKQDRALRTIALVGLPGSGKSSVGKALAALLSCRYADSDEAVSEAAGMAIPELFRQRGEAAFRDLESRMLDELTGPIEPLAAEPAAMSHPDGARRLVLSTGGGCVLSEANRRLLRERCFVIWLDISPQAAARRLAKTGRRAGSTGRPLLDSGDAAARLLALDAERRPLYKELADMRADAEPPGYRALARRIALALDTAAMEAHRAALS